MNKMMTWVLIVVAFLIGLFAGYYVERTRAISTLNDTKMSMQKAVDDANSLAKKATDEMMAAKLAMTIPAIVATAKNAKLGTITTDDKGVTLYTYDKDTIGKSNCIAACATAWPPYVVAGTVPATLPAHLSTLKRADGSSQYAWDGKPLYYYAGDKKAGDALGDGVGGVWHVAK